MTIMFKYSRWIFIQSEMQKEKINQHKNICTTSYDRIIDMQYVLLLDNVLNKNTKN